MADLQTTTAREEPAPKGFKLLNTTEGQVTVLRIGKKTGFLNHGQKPVAFPDEKNIVQPATQELLRAIYDTDASYAQLIEAPAGYKAPWASK